MKKGFCLKIVASIVFGVSISAVLIDSINAINVVYVIGIALGITMIVDDVVDQKFFYNDEEW